MSSYPQTGVCFLYDPNIYGLDASALKTIAGTVSLSTDKILVQDSGAADGELSTRDSWVLGDFRAKLTIPAVPTAGDVRMFGLYSKAAGLVDAAVFVTDGVHFYARSYDKDGNKEETEISWLAAWTNAATVFEIRFEYKDRVEFWVGGNRLASHQQRVPDVVARPFYIKNGNVDLMYVNLLDFRNSRDMTGLTEVGATVTVSGLSDGTARFTELPISDSTEAVTRVDSAALEGGHILKATAGNLWQVTGYNSSASDMYLQIHDSATVPAETSVPKIVMLAPGESSFGWAVEKFPSAFANGIYVCLSSTLATKTIAGAVAWFNGLVR